MWTVCDTVTFPLFPFRMLGVHLFFRSESGQTRLQCQRDLLLSSSSTQTHPAVTWCWFGGDTRSRLRDVACRSLQCNSRHGSEDNNRQATTSVKCCCTSCQRHQEVWSGTRSQLMHQESHWLDIPERVNYKLRVLTHQCLLGKTPVYLSNCCIPVSQVASRRHLRSAARHQLTVPQHRLSTYGRRAFAVTGPTMFNTLPDDLRDPAVSTSTFRQSLKTHLFSAYQHV